MKDVSVWVDEVARLYFEGYSVKAALIKTKVMKSEYETAFKNLIKRRQ